MLGIGIILQIIGLILAIVARNNKDDEEDEDDDGGSLSLVFAIIGFLIGLLIMVLSCRYAILSGAGLEKSIKALQQRPIEQPDQLSIQVDQNYLYDSHPQPNCQNEVPISNQNVHQQDDM